MSTPPLRRIGIVFNGSKPVARLEAFRAAAASALPASEIVVYPGRDGDDGEQQARRAVKDGCDLLVAAGGDGTVLRVLRGRGEQDLPLAFLPLGTSNDYARVLGVADDRAALAALIGGRLRRVDLVECQYHGPDGAPRRDLFCSSAGLGFTGAVTQSDRPGGALTYLKRWLGTGGFMVAGAAIALTFRGTRARIELDGVTRDLPAAVLEVSKMPWVTGRRLTPSSRPDDGKLDLVAFDGNLLRRARLLISVLGEGRHVAWPDFHYLRGFDEVSVETEQPLPLHIHGDWVGTGPARFRVRPGALPVLVP